MRALASTLDRAQSALRSASQALLVVDTGGLPAQLAATVEAERRSLGSQLAGTGAGLEAGSRYLTRTAEKVEHLDETGFFAATGVGVKVGDAIFGELTDFGLHKSDLVGRARRWAGVLGALTGTKALVQAAAWHEWGATARALANREEWRSATAVGRLRAVLDERIGAGLRANYGVRTPASYGPKAGKGLRKLGAKLFGAIPLVGGLADFQQYLAAGAKLRRDEPQTGVSQVLTDIRDGTALLAASAHLEADLFVLGGPFGVPEAGLAEGIGYAADGVVLGMDTTATAAKGAVAAAHGARDWAGRKIGAALRGAFG